MCSTPVMQSDLEYRGEPNLRSLWIEVPSHCHLNCPYCFTGSGREATKALGSLTPDDYKDRILRPFANAGGRWLGIPGAGEPFEQRNLDLTKTIIELSDELNLEELTIFTAGDVIDEELGRYLVNHDHVKVMVKWNSSNPEVQNRLVGDDSGQYFAGREQAWRTLHSLFEGQHERLGIVTSILAENWRELPDLLQFARDQGVVFDCDTLLPKGRGRDCAQKPTSQMVRNAIRAMQEVDEARGNTWPIAGAYVACSCNRYLHHLYVDCHGFVFPCVGACSLRLGNVKDLTLTDIWDTSERQALTQRVLVGACASCDRHVSGECSSCFGRNVATTAKRDILARGLVPTRPCPLFAPSFSVALHLASMAMRSILANPQVVDQHLERSLENLWDPCLLLTTRPLAIPEDSRVIVGLTDAPGDGEDDNFVRWCREEGLHILFSADAPLSLQFRTDGGETKRLIVLPDGYPSLEPTIEEQWKATDLDARALLGPQVVSWLQRRLHLKDAGQVAVSPDLAFLLSQCHDEEPLAPPAAFVQINTFWHILQIREECGSAPIEEQEGDDGNGEGHGQNPVRRFDMVNVTTGRMIHLGATWVKKQIALRDVPYSWDEFFDKDTGALRIGSGTVTLPTDDPDRTDDSEVSCLLPRLLIPLTSKVFENHDDVPLWVMWLFYDPCRNTYFRRLLDCRETSTDSDDAALKLLYLWPEYSRKIDAMLSEINPRPVQWFDTHILNLSDILRSPIIDYELDTAEDDGSSRGFGDRKFCVEGVLQSIADKSQNLLQAAKHSGLSRDEMHILETQPFVYPVESRVELYTKLANCLEQMATTLISPDESSEQVKTLYEMIPPALRQEIERVAAADEQFFRRAVNYFIWLGALKELGVRHYYVGQTLTHNLLPMVSGERPSDWNITPSGFIIASATPMSDVFLADLRLVFSTVMAPVIEQYARWTSDYEADRPQTVRNMPCLHRMPKRYVRSLQQKVLHPDTTRISVAPAGVVSECSRKHPGDLEWLRWLPKADLHVHLGPAIPPDVLFDLSALSLHLWRSSYRDDAVTGRATDAGKILKEIVDNAVKSAGDGEEDWIKTDVFKEAVIGSAQSTLGIDTILNINSMIEQVAGRNELPVNQCACIFNVVLGRLVRADASKRKDSLKRMFSRLKDFRSYLERLLEGPGQQRSILRRKRDLVASAYYRPHRRLLDSILEKYSGDETELAEKVDVSLSGLNLLQEVSPEVWRAEWGDPLSNLLSIPRMIHAEETGLGRYIENTDMTGSSVLQYSETLLLGITETLIHAARSDNIRYIEIKLSPQGLLGPPQPDIEDLVTSTALLAMSYVTDCAVEWLLEEGEKQPYWLYRDDENKWPYILGNLIIAGKRKDDKQALRRTVLYAMDSRERYLSAFRNCAQNEQRRGDAAGLGEQYNGRDVTGIVTDLLGSVATDLIVPRVVGIDLVGRERGIRHAELEDSMREAFEKCILLTIHAGEDEDVRSVWEAVFALHAQRIGHGLRIKGAHNLLGLLRDRRIPVELCPLSNQYTNGFHYDAKNYVFDEYRADHITLTINTDNPWISHRWQKAGVAPPYPLSDEFLVLPLLFKGRPSDRLHPLGTLSRLDALRLIFNGFDNAFLPAPDRDALLAMADLETFMVLRDRDLRYHARDVAD